MRFLCTQHARSRVHPPTCIPSPPSSPYTLVETCPSPLVPPSQRSCTQRGLIDDLSVVQVQLMNQSTIQQLMIADIFLSILGWSFIQTMISLFELCESFPNPLDMKIKPLNLISWLWWVSVKIMHPSIRKTYLNISWSNRISYTLLLLFEWVRSSIAFIHSRSDLFCHFVATVSVYELKYLDFLSFSIASRNIPKCLSSLQLPTSDNIKHSLPPNWS